MTDRPWEDRPDPVTGTEADPLLTDPFVTGTQSDPLVTDVVVEPVPADPGYQTGSESPSTRDVAASEARGVAEDAKQSGKDVAETAKAEAGQVASEAKSQARDLYQQAQQELSDQARSQYQRASGSLHSLADELDEMARAGQGGLAVDLVRPAAERTRSVADWLQSREPGDLLEEARRFARRKPGAFLLAAAAVGFVGGRLTRSLADEARDDSGSKPSAPRGFAAGGGTHYGEVSTVTGMPGTTGAPIGAASEPAYGDGGYGTDARPDPRVDPEVGTAPGFPARREQL